MYTFSVLIFVSPLLDLVLLVLRLLTQDQVRIEVLETET